MVWHEGEIDELQRNCRKSEVSKLSAPSIRSHGRTASHASSGVRLDEQSMDVLKTPQFICSVGHHALATLSLAPSIPLPSITESEVKNRPTMKGVRTNWSSPTRVRRTVVLTEGRVSFCTLTTSL